MPKLRDWRKKIGPMLTKVVMRSFDILKYFIILFFHAHSYFSHKVPDILHTHASCVHVFAVFVFASPPLFCAF